AGLGDLDAGDRRLRFGAGHNRPRCGDGDRREKAEQGRRDNAKNHGVRSGGRVAMMPDAPEPTLKAGERSGLDAGPLSRRKSGGQLQEQTTLPHWPAAIRSKPRWKSSIWIWCVSTFCSGKPVSTICVILYQVSY